MRKIIIALWAAIFAAASYYLISNDIHVSISEIPGILRENIHNAGQYGIYIFIAATIIRPLLLVPSSALMLAGGLLFGPIGIVYTLAGEIVASMLAFHIARYLGHDFVEEHTGQKFKNFEHRLEQHSFKSIILLRLMMIVPNDLISYAAGVSDITLTNFLIASSIGLVPHVIVFNSAAVGLGDVTALILPSSIIMLSIAFGKLIRYEYRKHKEKQLQVVTEVNGI